VHNYSCSDIVGRLGKVGSHVFPQPTHASYIAVF
jgi:hypothetical protein